MKIDVEFCPAVEAVTKKKHHAAVLDNGPQTLKKFFKVLVGKFGPDLQHALFLPYSYAMRPGIKAAVNGRLVACHDGLRTPLNDGDKVTIGATGK